MLEKIVDRMTTLFPETAVLGPDAPLFTSRLLDSFAVIEVIAELESLFGVTIDPADHELPDFDTFRKMEQLVGAKAK